MTEDDRLILCIARTIGMTEIGDSEKVSVIKNLLKVHADMIASRGSTTCKHGKDLFRDRCELCNGENK